jgi:SWI/SNF-related matrix-associated actin-dependent regulator of chromatin subfamily B protein 1
MTVGNFEVHLKNRLHREKVDSRVGKGARTGSVSSGGQGGAAAASSSGSS